MSNKSEEYYLRVKLDDDRNKREECLKKRYTPEQIKKIKEDEYKELCDSQRYDY